MHIIISRANSKYQKQKAAELKMYNNNIYLTQKKIVIEKQE